MATTSDANTSAATIVELTSRLEAQGFTAQFGVVAADEVRCFSCHEAQPAGGLHVEQVLRTEGVSDPDDMAAVAAVTCASCGAHGTLVLNYGPAASPDDSEVLRLL